MSSRFCDGSQNRAVLRTAAKQPVLGMIGAGILMLLVGGCSQPGTVLAGGKPVEYWLHALHAPDVKMRKKAVLKLGNAGTADPAVVPALVGALKDPSATVRGAAILALSKSDSVPSEAITSFADLQRRDRNATVRGYAGQALAKFASAGRLTNIP
jgi:hypothetical protein